jgi:menaquinone-dependent protoporphyrinogen oxidase
MTKKILVAYASRTGSTAGIAEAIAKTLSESDLEVDFRPIQEIQDLDTYQSVVLGSAIQDGKWLPEAMQFLKTHQAELQQKPFAAFLVCMTMAMKNETYRQGAKDWLAPVRTLVKPLREGYFAGVLDISKVPSFSQRLMFRLSVMMGVWTEGDHRDWQAIRAWAEDLKSVLEA